MLHTGRTGAPFRRSIPDAAVAMQAMMGFQAVLDGGLVLFLFFVFLRSSLRRQLARRFIPTVLFFSETVL